MLFRAHDPLLHGFVGSQPIRSGFFWDWPGIFRSRLWREPVICVLFHYGLRGFHNPLTAGIPTGVAFDIHKQIELRRAKERAAAPDNLAPDKPHVRQYVQVNVVTAPDKLTPPSPDNLGKDAPDNPV
jgi:hypothetical protein